MSKIRKTSRSDNTKHKFFSLSLSRSIVLTQYNTCMHARARVLITQYTHTKEEKRGMLQCGVGEKVEVKLKIETVKEFVISRRIAIKVCAQSFARRDRFLSVYIVTV